MKIFRPITKITVDKLCLFCYYYRAVGTQRCRSEGVDGSVGLDAGVAQPVEQLICNQQVGGSNPSTSSNAIEYGGIPEWPNGTDCKSAGNAFGGSNPPSPTNKRDIHADVSFIWRENRGGFEPRALRNVPGARFNPRRPARRQANPPYLLPAYTLHSRARRSLENSVDPNRDPNADRREKHRTVFARCFLSL